VNALSMGDGFKFGCGFFLAALVAWLAMAIIGLVAWLAMAIIGAILSLIATAILGISIGTLLGGTEGLSYLPGLLGVI